MRIRTIKPAFFRDPLLAQLPFDARLTFIGLWCYADDEGRGIDDARLIKSDIWPLDNRRLSRVEADLRLLDEVGLIERYSDNGRPFLWVRNFGRHQRVNRPTPSVIPASPAERQLRFHEALTEPSLPEGNKEKERNLPHPSAGDVTVDPRLLDVWGEVGRKLLAQREQQNGTPTKPDRWRAVVEHNEREAKYEQAADLIRSYPTITTGQLADALLGNGQILRHLPRAIA